MSDIDGGRVGIKTRGQAANKNESKKRHQHLPSSDDESVDSEMYSDDYDNGRGGRSKQLRSRRNASRSKSKSKKNHSKGRNLRTRGQKVNYNES